MVGRYGPPGRRKRKYHILPPLATLVQPFDTGQKVQGPRVDIRLSLRHPRCESFAVLDKRVLCLRLLKISLPGTQG